MQFFQHLGKKNYLCSRKKCGNQDELVSSYKKLCFRIMKLLHNNQLNFSLFNLKIKPYIL
jgi:hypothetical protein